MEQIPYTREKILSDLYKISFNSFKNDIPIEPLILELLRLSIELREFDILDIIDKASEDANENKVPNPEVCCKLGATVPIYRMVRKQSCAMVRGIEMDQKFCGTGGSSGCFAPDTLVLMADGTKKQIADIAPDELVATCEYFPSEIIGRPLWANNSELHKETRLVRTRAGDEIVCSNRQPFATPSGPVKAARIFENAELTSISIDLKSSLRGGNVMVGTHEMKEKGATLHSLEFESAVFFFVGESSIGVTCFGQDKS